MSILGITEAELIGFTNQGVDLLNKKCGIRRNYGYFSVFDITGENFLFIARIGLPPRASGFFVLSQEKATRLCDHPEHTTSFQSRDVPRGKLDGAVRFGPIILSFSGFQESLADEALVAFVGFRAGWAGKERLNQICRISNNPFIAQIIDLDTGA